MNSKQSDQLPFVEDATALVEYFKYLHSARDAGKQKKKRGVSLKKSQRLVILQKTDFRCHICGKPLTPDNFEADHVKAHITGGTHTIDHYLPGCKTCNNYRWHYSWEEIQYILKIGVWAKTLIERNSKLGKVLAEGFISYDTKREKRRKMPR